MARQLPLDKDSVLAEAAEGGALVVTEDVAYLRLLFVNVVFVGQPGRPGWVLVDAGIGGMAGRIRRAAAERFGADCPPAAIILTHGHFDHVGSAGELLAAWDVPVYAHPLELPYLDGRNAYPPPDPTVGGGAMAWLSPLYPRGPVDLRPHLRALPEDGSVPHMPGWQWLHTPGHSVGHVSLWREADRTLIPADAFVTTTSESAYASAVQEPALHGPPQYYTHDWQAAGASVARLAPLQPERVVPGHGRAMQGEAMRAALRRLADEFTQLAVPPGGRYVAQPRRAEDGSAYTPP